MNFHLAESSDIKLANLFIILLNLLHVIRGGFLQIDSNSLIAKIELSFSGNILI